jgi:PAS domain S-box-containing protein
MMASPTHTLLIVDDEVANRDMLSRRLDRRGYQSVLAASGQEALDYLAAGKVSAVLLDVQMPGLSGLQVLQEIRKTWTSARLPVIMVTAHHQSEDVVTALDLGANDYITKPIDFPVALARIRTQLSRKDAEDRLRDSEERYALAARGANDGLWDWDLKTGVFHFSARWKAIIGYDDADIGDAAEEWFDRVHPEDLPRLRRDLDAHQTGLGPHFENEHRMRHKSGAFRWVLTRGMAVRDADGKALRMAGSQSDITDGKVIDALTGLPNRVLLIDRLERVLQHQQTQPNSQFAVLFLDLDGFKLVNDSLGHLCGDELLQLVARRLESSLRQSDSIVRPAVAPAVAPAAPALTEHTLARLGGDEFVVLLHDVRGVVDATKVAERIQRALARPYEIGGREVYTSSSIGIAVGSTNYSQADDVLRDADTAMYRAKALGKGRAEVFDAAMREQVVERLRLDTALRLGLENHEFLPYYQPIIDLNTGELAGFEALLRWRQPDGSVVSPAAFVPVIEENGLVVPIGRKFAADVCRQLRAWQDADPDVRRLSVNVNFAGQQFMENGLLDSLLEMLDHAGLEPSHMVIEITESTAIKNFSQAAEILHRIRTAGMRVVLDDFGTGFSSLSCLHELPINGIKLDRSFISSERRHPAILRAMLMLAEQLGLSVTAEGIETVQQCQELRALECGFAQGFLFSPPVDAAAAGAMLRARHNWLADVVPSTGSSRSGHAMAPRPEPVAGR